MNLFQHQILIASKWLSVFFRKERVKVLFFPHSGHIFVLKVGCSGSGIPFNNRRVIANSTTYDIVNTDKVIVIDEDDW